MRKFRFASFNLYKFSRNSSKKLETIKAIIESNNVDIVAIQEIFSQEALNNLKTQMGSDWEGKWSSPNSRSASAAEGYAFLWNKNVFELASNKAGKVFEPVIHNQYPHKQYGELIRNPFYGRFVYHDNKMIEFRLLNTHIMFSSKKELNESEDHDSSILCVGDVTARKRELRILANHILPKINDKAYDRQWNEIDDMCKRPYTILLGDYNLNLKNSDAKDAFIDDDLAEICICDGQSFKRIITEQKQLTTLKAKTKDTGIIDGYKNNFDHFTYDAERSMKAKCWAADYPKDKMKCNYNKYKQDVSDHLMIIMEVELI